MSSVSEIKNILFRALAFAELGAPASAQGAFIAAGNQFDAFSAVSKILGEAKSGVLLVDPYMDASTLMDFAVLAPEGVLIRLLADEDAAKPSLAAAIPRWISQHRAESPNKSRLAPPRSLHDRSIQIDGNQASRIATQWFEDFATRSPCLAVAPGGRCWEDEDRCIRSYLGFRQVYHFGHRFGITGLQ